MKDLIVLIAFAAAMIAVLVMACRSDALPRLPRRVRIGKFGMRQIFGVN